jgi:hypothetical protein
MPTHSGSSWIEQQLADERRGVTCTVPLGFITWDGACLYLGAGWVLRRDGVHVKARYVGLEGSTVVLGWADTEEQALAAIEAIGRYGAPTWECALDPEWVP